MSAEDPHGRAWIMKVSEAIYLQTNFTKKECERLLTIYKKLVSGNADAKLDRSRFKEVLHNSFSITDEMMLDQIFRAFDTDSDSIISAEEWVKGMSTFLRGTLDEKTKFAFRAYDLNGSGAITRESMFQLLKSTLIRNGADFQPAEEDPEEGVRDLVEVAFKKFDTEKRGSVDFAQFKRTVAQDPLLLQALGACLPDESTADAFLCTFEESHLPTTISYIAAK